jgi:C1A family cysteine protease
VLRQSLYVYEKWIEELKYYISVMTMYKKFLTKWLSLFDSFKHSMDRLSYRMGSSTPIKESEAYKEYETLIKNETTTISYNAAKHASEGSKIVLFANWIFGHSAILPTSRKANKLFVLFERYDEIY